MGVDVVDFLTPEERSRRMARIKSSHTKPEVALRKALHGLGLRYRLDGGKLPGKPDLVFPRHKAIVFVHGCFWHHHLNCKAAAVPKSNTDFWIDKFSKNVARDERVISSLKNLGWRVFVVWECEVSSQRKTNSTALNLSESIRNQLKHSH